MFQRRKYLFLLLFVLFFFFLFTFKMSFKEFGVVVLNMGFILDIELINKMASDLGFDIYVIDSKLLSFLNKNISNKSPFHSPVIFGIEAKYVDELRLIKGHKFLKKNDIKFEIFYNNKPLMQAFGFKLNSTLALILQKHHVHIFQVLYPREDNTWWYGNLASDERCSYKLQKFLLPNLNCNSSVFYENILNKFKFTIFNGFQHPLSHILIPKDQNNFIKQSENLYFIECNYSRAELFRNTFMQSYSSSALHFKHRAWKLLSKTKTILDILSIPFWISSGTCLGFFRECDIIPHSKDVDIGIFAEDYNETIISRMEEHGLILKHWFGLLNDSLELSFVDKWGLKLDIFFFYKEEKYFWNGGTQLRTGKKYKYIFPKFKLCWTLFCGLKVRIPCETESYIIANYGNNWFTPLYNWDWKSSPHNVKANGFWPVSFQRSHLLKIPIKATVSCAK